MVGVLYGDESKTRGLCFKQFPEFPGIEYAIHTLGKRLFGAAVTPPGKLARMGNDVFWVSHFVPGDTLQTVLDESPDPEKLKNLDPQRLGESIILSILTNPEDGRTPNYIVTRSDLNPGLWKIVGIDNDHSFGSGCFQKVREGLFQTAEIKGNCALFCLDQMNSKIDDSIRETFLKLDLKELFGGWIKDLKEGQEYCQMLFNRVEAQQFYQDHDVILDFPIPIAWLQHLYAKLLTMQLLTAADINKKLTYLQLLGNCEPSVGRRYAMAAQKFKEGPYHLRHRVEETDSRRMSTISGRIYRREVLGIKDDATTLTEQERGALFFGSIDDIIAMLQGLHTTQDLEFQKEVKVFEKRSAVEQELFLATLSRHPQRTPEEEKAYTLPSPSSPQPSFAAMSDSDQKRWLRLIQKKGRQDISYLELAHCRVLENNDLARMPLQNLRTVYLCDCPQLTKKGIRMLAQGAQGLRHLTLQNLLNIRRLEASQLLEEIDSFSIPSFSIPFTSLVTLTLDNLPAIKSLQIYAPCLRELWIANCPLLQDIRGESGDLKELGLHQVDRVPEKELLEQVRNLATYQAFLAVNSHGRKELLPIVLNSCTEIDWLRSDLFDNRALFGTNGQKALARALATNTSLVKLHLSCAQQWYHGSSAGMKALTQALLVNTTLTHLKLQDLQIGDAGAENLAHVLTTNPTLTQLELPGHSNYILGMGNRISSRGAKALAKALTANTTLINLDLWSNNIGDIGAGAFASALAVNSTLVHLRLGYNDIGDSGAELLARSLETNSSLRSLHLGRNNIHDDGEKALHRALATNTTLTELDLQGGDYGIGAHILSYTLSRQKLAKVAEVRRERWDNIRGICNRNRGFTTQKRTPETATTPSALALTSHVHVKSAPRVKGSFPLCEKKMLSHISPSAQLEILGRDYGAFSEDMLSEKAPTFLSLQGRLEPSTLLEDLEGALHDFVYTDEQGPRRATIQRVFKRFSGSGEAGALGLLLFQQRNPHPTSYEVKQALLHDHLPPPNVRIRGTARPFVLTMADSSGNSVTPYDYRRAQEDDAHNISVGELARRLFQSPASDGSLALYRYRKPHQQPLFVVFGASPNTPETLAAIRERGDHAVFVGPGTDIPQLVNLLCARTGLTRRAEATPDPLTDSFDAEVARVNHVLSTSLMQFYEGLAEGGAAGGAPSPEETRAAQAEIRQILEGHAQRVSEAEESRLYTVLRRGRALQHRLLGHSVSFQDTFEERIAREHQTHVTALQEAFSESAFEKLEAYREWKRQVWIATLKCQLQKAFCTYSALALGTVARKTELMEYLRSGGLSLAGAVLPKVLAKITEGLPIPGISTLASVINTADAVRRDLIMKEHCNKITALWGQEGLDEMASLSTTLAQDLGKRINSQTIDTLTVESLQRLAFLSVDQVVAYVVQNKEGTPSPDDLLTAPFADDKEWLGNFIDGWTALSQESPDAPDLQAWPLLQKNRIEEAQGGARGGIADLTHEGRRRVGS